MKKLLIQFILYLRILFKYFDYGFGFFTAKDVNNNILTRFADEIVVMAVTMEDLSTMLVSK